MKSTCRFALAPVHYALLASFLLLCAPVAHGGTTYTWETSSPNPYITDLNASITFDAPPETGTDADISYITWSFVLQPQGFAYSFAGPGSTAIQSIDLSPPQPITWTPTTISSIGGLNLNTFPNFDFAVNEITPIAAPLNGDGSVQGSWVMSSSVPDTAPSFMMLLTAMVALFSFRLTCGTACKRQAVIVEAQNATPHQRIR